MKRALIRRFCLLLVLLLLLGAGIAALLAVCNLGEMGRFVLFMRSADRVTDDRAGKGEIFEFVCVHEDALLLSIQDGTTEQFENVDVVRSVSRNRDVVDFGYCCKYHIRG